MTITPISERPSFPSPPRGLPVSLTTWASDMVKVLTQIAGEANPQINALIRRANEVANVVDYGATGDGVTDDAEAVARAFNSGRKNIRFPPDGTYLLGATFGFTSSHNGLKIFADGATLKKGFNGDLFTYTGASDIEWIGGVLDGNHGTHTGKCFVLSGASDDPIWDRVVTVGFTDSHYEFGADSGKRAKLTTCRGQVASGQATTTRHIHFNGPDTLAMQRGFVNCNFNGFVDCDGARDTYFAATALTYCDIDAATQIFSYIGGIWGNSGLAASIGGTDIHIHGTRMAAALTLASASKGSFVGVNFTSGGLTDNSTPGNWLMIYKPSGVTDYVIGKSLLNVSASVAERIQTSRSISAGDANTTFTPSSSAPVIRYATTLTANRAVTLSTTNATAGTRLRVVRDGAGAFTLDVGGLKTLAVDEWCDVEYTGSAYFLTAFGTL